MKCLIRLHSTEYSSLSILPTRMMQINALLVLVLTFGAALRCFRGASTSIRPPFGCGSGAAVLGISRFCLFCQKPSQSRQRFMAAPLAFLGPSGGFGAFGAALLAPFVHLPKSDSLSSCCFGEVPDLPRPLIAKSAWRDIAVFIERAFPQGTRVWMGDKLAALLQWNLLRRGKPCERGVPMRVELGSGRLVVVRDCLKR